MRTLLKVDEQTMEELMGKFKETYVKSLDLFIKNIEGLSERLEKEKERTTEAIMNTPIVEVPKEDEAKDLIVKNEEEDVLCKEDCEVLEYQDLEQIISEIFQDKFQQKGQEIMEKVETRFRELEKKFGIKIIGEAYSDAEEFLSKYGKPDNPVNDGEA